MHQQALHCFITYVGPPILQDAFSFLINEKITWTHTSLIVRASHAQNSNDPAMPTEDIQQHVHTYGRSTGGRIIRFQNSSRKENAHNH